MDLKQAGKRALITGGSKGIGYACAVSFASEGVQPVLVARSADGLARAAASLREATGASAEIIALDVAGDGAAAALLQRAGHIDFLINNAGAIPAGDLQQVDDARWRAAWELKLFGYINLSRAWLPQMQARRDGVIVNVVGMAGVAHRSTYLCGSMANAALIAFTNAVGAASTKFGVRVFGVNPGQTRTERMLALRAEGAAPALSAGLAFGRPAEPHEIADLVVFGCSPRAGYLSGTVVNVDGGQQYSVSAQ